MSARTEAAAWAPLLALLAALQQPAVRAQGQPLAPHAAPEAPLRVLVHVQSDLDRALLDRVRGQISDLRVELVAADEPSPSAELAARARHAQERAAAQGAAVAIWFALEPNAQAELLVFVASAGNGPVLVRRIAAGDGSEPSSGALESAALVVRSSLRTLAQGEPLGVELPRSGETADLAGPPPRPIDTRAPADPSPAIEPAEQEPPRDAGGESGPGIRPRIGLFAGWQGAIDGSGSPGHHGALLRVHVELGALELGASAGLSYPVTRSDALADVRLARHSALASVGLRAASGALSWSGGAHAGVVLLQRTSHARSARFAPDESSVVPALALGPWLGASWMPGWLGLGAQLGLDVLPDPPWFVYEDENGDRTPAHRPWAVQPRAAAGVIGRLP